MPDDLSPRIADGRLSLADAPSLIETTFPVSRLSLESFVERDAKQNQTLTATGSYWKGRKPLVLVRACVLAALLPPTGTDAEGRARDVEMFLKLMVMDDAGLRRRHQQTMRAVDAAPLLTQDERDIYFQPNRVQPRWRTAVTPAFALEHLPAAITDVMIARVDGELNWTAEVPDCLTLPEAEESPDDDDVLDGEEVPDGEEAPERRRWSPAIAARKLLRQQGDAIAFERMTYKQKLNFCIRSEELDGITDAAGWDEINAHYGTSAQSMQAFIEQLGILRFGRRPRVSDRFAGGGSIPFEAARMGCDVEAADLNPIAGMLTWAALNVVGGTDDFRSRLAAAQKRVADAVDARLIKMGTEHDQNGNRAKAFLYCLETRCPTTGWLVPMSTTWIVNKRKGVVLELIENNAKKQFDFRCIVDASDEQITSAGKGTCQGTDLVYTINGINYRRSLKSVRGDVRVGRDTTNALRSWGLEEIRAKPDDIYQERLICIRWIGKQDDDDIYKAPGADDLDREEETFAYVQANLKRWQAEGVVPDMEIAPGDKTDELIRTRGWRYWHHLFHPRQILLLAFYSEEMGKEVDADVQAGLSLIFNKLVDHSSRLCHWHPSWAKPEQVFYNQAFNTFFNYGVRAFRLCDTILIEDYRRPAVIQTQKSLTIAPASAVSDDNDLYITDPPYADAIHYHEITEFFIAWLRRNPPRLFSAWPWDSRRGLAIQGKGTDFRRSMIDAYRAMTKHMPDNGMQIVMFTHQDAAVWADLAMILWAAGLRVTAAWCIVTEVEKVVTTGNYVQGTVVLVLRKRLDARNGWAEDVLAEVEDEVISQIRGMHALDEAAGEDGTKHFADADLQLAAYAAALRVVTSYGTIEGRDVGAEVLRERTRGEKTEIQAFIERAVGIANNYLVPEGLSKSTWESLPREARFYLKMVEVESRGGKQLSAYAEFGRAFGLDDHRRLLASGDANDARLKWAADFRGRDLGESGFGTTLVRHILFGIHAVMTEENARRAVAYLRQEVPDYWKRRQAIVEIARFLANRKAAGKDSECAAAEVLAGAVAIDRV